MKKLYSELMNKMGKCKKNVGLIVSMNSMDGFRHQMINSLIFG